MIMRQGKDIIEKEINKSIKKGNVLSLRTIYIIFLVSIT